MFISIEESPKVLVVEESENIAKIIMSGPIFHSWLRNDEEGIIGLKFSSWMANQSKMSKPEKDLLNTWNKSKSDFEIFFGEQREYNVEKSLDEVVLHTSIIKFDKFRKGFSFPLFGKTTDKNEMMNLEMNLKNRLEEKAAA